MAFCSRLVRSGPWELAARSEFRSIFGTITLDLSQARLAGPEVDLQIYNLFGTVTIIVPESVDVSVSGGGMFASQVIQPHTAPPVAGAPKLRINARGPGGTLCRRMAYDNQTAELMENTVERCLEARPRDVPRASNGFAWGSH